MEIAIKAETFEAYIAVKEPTIIERYKTKDEVAKVMNTLTCAIASAVAGLILPEAVWPMVARIDHLAVEQKALIGTMLSIAVERDDK